jgi:uncharacterized protein (UPF0276 family)
MKSQVTPLHDPTRRTGPAGVGLGLRWDFLDDVVEHPEGLDVAFWEVSPENYMRRGGWYPAALEQVAERYEVVTHGLTMSLGAVDEPSDTYLAELRTEIARVRSPWHSDHLCLSTAGSRVLHDLLPLKLSQRNVEHVADRIRRVQDRLGVPMAFENISWYAHPGRPEMPEHEFINRILQRSGCGLLLDVNNVYVNAQNHAFDAGRFLAQLDLTRVFQIHVAGHTRTRSGLIIDTHGAPVIDPVLDLLTSTVERTGPLPVLLERDNDIPPLTELVAEVRHIDRYYQRGVARHAEGVQRASA